MIESGCLPEGAIQLIVANHNGLEFRKDGVLWFFTVINTGETDLLISGNAKIRFNIWKRIL